MTALELSNRTLTRLGEDPADPIFFKKLEVLNALNRGQRLFAFFTLCLEGSLTLPLVPGAWLYDMSTQADWLFPLRVTNSAGGKVSPATLEELYSFDENWRGKGGAATHYGALGFYRFFVRGTTDTLTVLYARMPATMVNDSDQAEIIDAYQPTLIDYAEWRVRCKQGGQEFSKNLPLLKRFLDGAKEAAEDTLSRSIAAGNDRQPVELSHYKLTLPKLAATKTDPPGAAA